MSRRRKVNRTESISISPSQLPPVSPSEEEISSIEEKNKILYIGNYQEARRLGSVTKKFYIFSKDNYNSPIPTEVYKQDVPALLAEKGRGCISHAPERIFVTEEEWQQELASAKKENT